MAKKKRNLLDVASRRVPGNGLYAIDPFVDRWQDKSKSPGLLATGLLETIAFACEAHAHHKRVTGGAYINHPIRVATSLRQLRSTASIEENKDHFKKSGPPYIDLTDAVSTEAAILHDVLEDTSVTESEMRYFAGDQVTDLVVELSDDMTLDKKEQVKASIEGLSHKSKRAQLIKLLDFIDNMQEPPEHWMRKDQDRWRAFKLRGLQYFFQQGNLARDYAIFNRVYETLWTLLNATYNYAPLDDSNVRCDVFNQSVSVPRADYRKQPWIRTRLHGHPDEVQKDQAQAAEWRWDCASKLQNVIGLSNEQINRLGKGEYITLDEE